MFLPSRKALVHLCNALMSYGQWHPLLQGFGLADAEGWADAMSMREPELFPQEFTSWDGLMSHLESAKGDGGEQLRSLCSDLLRKKERYASVAARPERFADELAAFEAQLLQDGYHMADFEIVGSRALPPIARLADDALQEIVRLGSIPLCDKIREHLERSKNDLSDGRYPECLSSLRLALKYSLEAVARRLAESRGEQLPSEKEDEVRSYLRKAGLLSEEEWRGFWGIYGLLSAGPHGHADERLALLGYAACVMACQYVIGKVQGAG
jgi:hypothetical protein